MNKWLLYFILFSISNIQAMGHDKNHLKLEDLKQFLQNKNFASARQLIERGEVDIHATDGQALSPLIESARSNVDIITFTCFLRYARNVNEHNNLLGTTPLIAAVSQAFSPNLDQNQKIKVQLLLNQKADVNFLSKAKYTALSEILSAYPAYKKNEPIYTEVISLLLKKNADPNKGSILHDSDDEISEFSNLGYVRHILKDEPLAQLLIEHGAKEELPTTD